MPYHFHLCSDWKGLGSLPRGKWPHGDWALLLACLEGLTDHEVLLPYQVLSIQPAIQGAPIPWTSLSPWPRPVWLIFLLRMTGDGGCSVLYEERQVTQPLDVEHSEWLLSWLVGQWMNQFGYVGLELVIGGIYSLCKSSWQTLVRVWWGTLLLRSL